jgi:phosphatidylglycerophosphate synthase
MYGAKLLAETLTALRFVLAAFIAWSAWTQPRESTVGTIAMLTILAWTTDWLDGPLARRAPVDRQTWLGAHDLTADLSLVLALAVSLAVWGAVPMIPLVIALVVGVFGKRVFHSLAPLQLMMGLIYGAFILVAWQSEAAWGLRLVAWIALSVVLHPRRAWSQISGFLESVGKISRGMLDQRSG